MPFVAFLDACVLHPASLRDTLLRCAEAQLFQVRWSRGVLDEMYESILRRNPQVTPSRLEHTIDQMQQAFPEAEVLDYAGLEADMTNDPGDRHVLAAAVVGRADVVVTDNVSDFPFDACGPYNIEVQTADTFLTHTFYLSPHTVIGVLRQQAADKVRPPLTFLELLERLVRTVPALSETVRDWLRNHPEAASL